MELIKKIPKLTIYMILRIKNAMYDLACLDDETLLIEVQNCNMLALIDIEFLEFNTPKEEASSSKLELMVDYRLSIFNYFSNVKLH